MTTCSNCGKQCLHQDEEGWFCLGCHAVGLGQQPADLRERPCVKCGIKSFCDVCYLCEKKYTTSGGSN